ncbi:MAG: signal peptidase I [Woeseiaceae bacterium]
MKQRKSWLKTELPQILLILVAVFAARSTLADHYYVPSGSMEYTLLSGDRVLVNKAAYGLRVPFTKIEVLNGSPVSRGDVVIFDSPRDGTRLIKRIVAVGGDSVVLSAGHLTVNGRSMAADTGVVEDFGERTASLNLEHGGGPDIDETIIPAGMLLAIGDHRGSSLDGRYFGLVPETEIYGKALGVYRRKEEGFTWRPL